MPGDARGGSLATRTRAFVQRNYAKRLRKLHPLQYVFWESTLRCNLTCRHCGSSCDSQAAPDELTTTEVTAAFDDIAEHHDASKILVAITGGEPLVRKDLYEVMAHLNELGFKIGMVSNGMAINTPAAEKLVANGLKTISISIDGTKRTHDFIRNKKGSFVKAMRAMALLGQYPEVASEALSIVTAYNVDDLAKLYDFLRSEGVQRWRLETVIPIGRAAQDDKLALNSAQLRELLDFVVEKRQQGDLSISFGCEGWLGYNYELKARDKFFLCHAGVTIGSILANGDISACPDIRGGFVQGNVRRDSFSRVWQTGFGEYRDRKWMKSSLCAGCDAWKDCVGGAMHMWTPEREKLGCVYQTLCNNETRNNEAAP